MHAKQPIGTAMPIGVFDSGVGGLSVLRHIRSALPHEHVLYVADSDVAPYGDKPEQVVMARVLGIARFLQERGAKALVVACNTATGAAIQALREHYPGVPIVGVEPGLKPAAAMTCSRIVKVLATERTLASSKFSQLQQQISDATGVCFLLPSCAGLASQIEKGKLASAKTAALVRRYVKPLLQNGADTLVLGCTHYPFVQPLIHNVARHSASVPINLVDTGEAVAKQLARLLMQHQLQCTDQGAGTLACFTTGSPITLTTAVATLLKLHPDVTKIDARVQV